MAHNVVFKKNEDQLEIQIEGTIDEDTHFSHDALKGAKVLVFDFSEVRAINSCGIREWIKWIKPFDQSSITYRKCPKIIVDQINMIDGFLPPTALVESFYVPYYSDSTGEEKQVLFSQGKEFDEMGVKCPNNIVDSKNQPMEIDVMESKYFKFLKKKIAKAA